MPMVRRIAGMFRRKLTTSGGKELHDRSRLQPVWQLARLNPQPRMRRQRAVLKLSKRSSP